MKHDIFSQLSELGIVWHEDIGQVVLPGSVFDYMKKLDAFFVYVFRKYACVELKFPIFIQAKELQKIDYFSSFPNTVVLPVSLPRNTEAIQRFKQRGGCSSDGSVQLVEHDSICHCLAPAACYPIYIQHKHQVFECSQYFTTLGTCFRREKQYEPLQRMSQFSMREFVCIGTSSDVAVFMEYALKVISDICSTFGLDVSIEQACDPFFDPERNPKYLMQKIYPVKREFVFNQKLALGSVNCHYDHFSTAFDVHVQDQETHTACVAFGLERWLYAWVDRFGTDVLKWPDLQGSVV